MNAAARAHLAKARDYVDRGEQFYRMAAEQIMAAQSEDPTLGYREIGEWFGHSDRWARRIVTWSTSAACTDTLPSSEPQGSVAKRHARSVLRDAPIEEIAEQFISDPVIRDKVGRALDRHYAAETAAKKEHQREREVGEHGGEDEHKAYQRRMRIAEVVNVARGLSTGMQFVVQEVRRLHLDEFAEAGVIETLVGCAGEVEGFAVLLRQFLAGEQITDEQIGEWIRS